MFTNCSPLFTFVHQSKKTSRYRVFTLFPCLFFSQLNMFNLTYLNLFKLLKFKLFTHVFICL
nr:MAG TPA: ATPase [Caudoviricetes sp.]